MGLLDSLYVSLGLLLLAYACAKGGRGDNNDESSLVAELLKRMEALEERDSIQQKLIVGLQRQLTHQKEDIGRMKRAMVARDRRIRAMQHLLEKKEMACKTINKSRMTEHQTQSMKKEESNERRIRQTDLSPTVAFSAAVSRTTHALVAQEIIVFDHVFTNIRNGYNENTGVFIPPYSGTYVLFMSIYAAQNHDIRAQFMVNGVHKNSAYAESLNYADDTSSQMIILHLNKGDIVAIELFAAAELVYGSGSYYSSFSGFLLHQEDSMTG